MQLSLTTYVHTRKLLMDKILLLSYCITKNPLIRDGATIGPGAMDSPFNFLKILYIFVQILAIIFYKNMFCFP